MTDVRSHIILEPDRRTRSTRLIRVSVSDLLGHLCWLEKHRRIPSLMDADTAIAGRVSHSIHSALVFNSIIKSINIFDHYPPPPFSSSLHPD